MMKYAVLDDMVLGRGVGFDGVPAADLDDVPVDRLRFDGRLIVDIEAQTDFFIDVDGQKHLVQHDAAWQPLICAWDDVIVNDAGVWRVENSGEALQKIRDLKLIALKEARNAALSGGFVSAALGANHTYDCASPFDYTNLIGAHLAGAALNFTCTDGAGVKIDRLHTAAQIAQVFADGVAHVQTHHATYDALRAAVRNAIDEGGVNAVVWR